MDIANITKYDHVYDHLCSCEANYHMQKHPLGAFVLFEEAKEASSNSLQQLQAKIAALATRVEASYTVETPLKELSAIVYEMRQLSAMQ